MKKLLLLIMLLFLFTIAFANVYPIGTLGTSSAATYGPISGFYDFGWTKAIFTAAEITAAGYDGTSDIVGVAYYVGNTPSNYVIQDVHCFIRHTALTTYTTVADETGQAMPDSSTFTQVFSGNLTFNGGGWHNFIFNLANFNWDGTSNIEIFWKNWDGDYVTGYPTYRYASTSPDYKLVYKQQDTTWPTGDGARSTSRSNLAILTPATAAPNPAVLIYPSDGGWTFLDGVLGWQAAQSGDITESYDVYFGTVNPPVTQVSDNQTTTTYTPTLAANTTYYWRVDAVNGFGTTAGTVWSFKTPAADQLAESFEVAVPPPGWTNPGTWSRGTSYKYHGTAAAYKAGSTTSQFILSTPKVVVTSTSTLDFWSAGSSTTAQLQIVTSPDGTTWTQLGATMTHAATYTFEHRVIDLSSLTPGDYYLGFRTGQVAGTSYIDHVFGPTVVAIAPGPVTLTEPANGADPVSLTPTFTWTDSYSGGIPLGYKVYCDTNADPSTLLATVTGLTYTHTTPLNTATAYNWKVVAYNTGFESSPNTIWSFTTANPPLTGTKTIGGEAADYATFTEAITDLNISGLGISGVTFVVADGTYNESPPAITTTGTSTAPIIFQAAVSANPVVTPAGGTGTYGFKLSGVDYVTFNNIDVSGPNTLIYGYWLAGLTDNGATNNTIQNCTITVPYGSSTNYGIYSNGATGGANSFNTFTGNTVNSSYHGIYVTGSSTAGYESSNVWIGTNTISEAKNYAIYIAYSINFQIQNNIIAFATGGSTSYNGVRIAGDASTGTVQGNTLSGGSTSSTVYIFYHDAGTVLYYNNTINGPITTGSSTWYGMYGAGAPGADFFLNTISGISNSGTGSTYCAYLTTGSHKVRNCTISNVSGGGTVYGIYMVGGTTHNVYNNKIHNLSYSGTGTGLAYGIYLAGAANMYVYNNMVYDLRNTGGTTAPQIRGIYVSSGTNDYIWNNSVYLNAPAGTAANFTTAALQIASSTALIDLKNNIFVNHSAPGSTGGNTVASYIGITTFPNFSTTTDKNIYYAGEPDADHIIGYFNSTEYQTLGDYKALAVTVDQGSYSEDVPYISIVSPYDLHIDEETATVVEGNAIPIAEVTTDIDGNARNATTPDIGADEGDFLGIVGPAEPPDHVTLLSPAFDATMIDPENVLLAWTPADTGGIPDYYEVYVSTDPEDPYSQIFIDNVTSTNITIDLNDHLAFVNPIYSRTLYWAVNPVKNGYGSALDDDPNIMVWRFTTAYNPLITTLPYTQDFDDDTPPALPWGWTANNVNGDAYTWVNYATTNALSAPNCASIRYNSTLPHNDWLISPPVELQTGNTYSLEFYYMNNSTYYTDKMKVMLGTSDQIADLTTQLFINEAIQGTTYSRAFATFTVPTNGNYYLGWHCYSVANQYYLYVDDIKIASVPSVPTIGITPTAINFINAYENSSSAAVDVTVRNIGTGNLELTASNLSLIGTDSGHFSFSAANLPVTLAFDQTVTIPVQFTPTTPGAKTASLRVSYNSVNNDVALSGRAFPADFIFESFETAVPPVGWANPGGWLRGTSYYLSGTAAAYKSLTQTPALLVTPVLRMTAQSVLSFYARPSTTTGYGRIQIKYSTDGSTWSDIGSVIEMPTESTWQNYEVDLSTLSGNDYVLAFEGYSSSTTAATVYIDHVFAPGLAPLVPSPATVNYPAHEGWALPAPTLNWSPGLTGGLVESYDVYFGTDNPPATLVSDDQTGTTYTAGTLLNNTTYYWQVIPRNADGPASGCPVWSFSTPMTSQLAESFDVAVPPNIYWDNPGSYTRSTTTPFYGTAGAYKSLSTTPAMLITPKLGINSSSELDFYYRTGSTNGYGRLQIKYSPDKVTWTPVGDEIAFPVTTTWNHMIVALGSIPAGNYYLGFDGYTTSSTASIYLDHIIGPEYAAEVPDPATLVFPPDYCGAFTNTTLSWNPSATGGITLSYDVYLGETEPLSFIGNQTETTYSPVLEEGIQYLWQIIPRNAAGPAEDCPIWSFWTPTNTQLAESFEVATPFLPLGWANPGSWSGTTTSPFHGSRVAYKSASTTPALLSTPLMSFTGQRDLHFFYRTASTNGYGRLQIKTSPDRVTWTNQGDPIAMPTTTTWNRGFINLDNLVGNYYIGFEVYTTTSTASIYLDYVFGFNYAQVTPGAVALSAPADLATDISAYPTFTWTDAVTGGMPAGYKVYCDTSPNPSTLLATVPWPNMSYSASQALTYGATYYWKVVATNGGGDSEPSSVRSFTVLNQVSDYPFTEGFEATTFPPTGWSVYNMDTGSTNWVRNTTSTYIHSGSASARHTYSTSPATGQDGWLVTPPLAVPNGPAVLSFWSYNSFATSYDYNGVLVSTESPNPADEDYVEVWTTASVTTAWVNTYVDLTPYGGQTIYIAFRYMGYNAHAWALDDLGVYTSDAFAPQLTHLPPLNNPRSDVPYSVKAIASDDAYWNTAISVEMTYSVNGGAGVTVPMTLSGGYYTADIPAQPLGTNISNYVVAKDVALNTSTSTAATFSIVDPAWQIYDSGTQTTGLGSNSGIWGGGNVFVNPLYGSGIPMKILSSSARATSATTANIHVYSFDGTTFTDLITPVPVTFVANTQLITDLSGLDIQITAPYFMVSYEGFVGPTFMGYDQTRPYGTSIWISGGEYSLLDDWPGCWMIRAQIQSSPAALAAPVVTITKPAQYPVLAWLPVSYAASYKVYGSADPYAADPWTVIATLPNTTLTYTYTGTEAMKFFKVTANSTLPARGLDLPPITLGRKNLANVAEEPKPIIVDKKMD